MLFIVLSIVFAIVKWLLRKLAPKAGVMKAIDHILGGVFNFALYGVIMLCLLGMVGTLGIEGVNKALDESKFQNINFMQEFCDKNLNIGNLIEEIKGGIDIPGQTPEGGMVSLSALAQLPSALRQLKSGLEQIGAGIDQLNEGYAAAYTALASAISLPELTFQSLEVMAVSRITFELWLVTAAMYLLVSCFWAWLGRRLEKRR